MNSAMPSRYEDDGYAKSIDVLGGAKVYDAVFFPIDVLPNLIRQAVLEAQTVSQAPVAMVAGAAFAAASLAVQTRWSIKRLGGLSSPCSVFVVTIAESGERKTTVDQMFLQAVRDFERERVQDLRDQDGFVTPPEKLKKKNRRQGIRLLYADATPASVVVGLRDNSRSGALCEDEGGRFFSSRLVTDLGLLNKLWGGNDIAVDRKYESFIVLSPRFTASLMIQPAIFQQAMERKGDEARGIGFLARCLVSYPASTQGQRFIRDLPENLEALESFNARVKELLEDQQRLFAPITGGCMPEGLIELTFSVEAQGEWERLFDAIECAIRPGGYFCENRDYASKIAENIARMAGIFHAFEGYGGAQISLETLKAAAKVVLWYAREFVRLFSPPRPEEIVQRYAILLEEWLVAYVRRTNVFFIKKSYILQLGPNSLRKAEILDLAIQRIIETGRAMLVPQYINVNGAIGRKAVGVLSLNQHYFTVRANGATSVFPFCPL